MKWCERVGRSLAALLPSAAQGRCGLVWGSSSEEQRAGPRQHGLSVLSVGKLLREASWSLGPDKPRTAEPPAVGARCSHACEVCGTSAHRSGLYSGQGLLCRYCMMYTMD